MLFFIIDLFCYALFLNQNNEKKYQQRGEILFFR
jgi:hypothetical protein